MNIQAILRGGAVCAAAMFALSGAAMTGFAEESSEAPETESAADSEDEVKTYTSGDYTYSVVIDGDDTSTRSARIESYSGSEEEIEIPAELDGLEVVSLGDTAFAGARLVKKFTIPKTLTEIGKYTFADCSSLLSYEVEEGSLYFESKDGVLYGDEGVSLLRYPVGTKPTEVVIPEGVEHIGHVAFSDCSSLTSVTFPDSLNYIGVSAFSDCTGLTEITLPENITSIQDFTFNCCTNLKTVKLPDALTSIGMAAFTRTAIENITLPEGLTYIGEQAFIATPMMEITVPRSVTEIGYSALGWDETPEELLYCKDDFVVRGYKGSAADDYVNAEEYENTCKFEAIDEISSSAEEGSQADSGSSAEDSEDSAADEEEPADQKDNSGNSGAVKVVGIAACGAAILGILGAAVFSGKKKKEAESKEEPKDEA